MVKPFEFGNTKLRLKCSNKNTLKTKIPFGNTKLIKKNPSLI